MLLPLVCGRELISKRLKERRNLKKSAFKRKAAELAAERGVTCSLFWGKTPLGGTAAEAGVSKMRPMVPAAGTHSLYSSPPVCVGWV